MLKILEKYLNMESLSKYNFEYLKTLQEYKRDFKSEGIAIVIDETTRNIYFRQLKDNSFPEMKAQEIFYQMVIDGLIENTSHSETNKFHK